MNLIYDSIGNYSTPTAFFQRLRDGGIQVVEFNPINLFKAHGHWLLAHPDHRKILIIDGKVAFTGSINISSVYSSRLSGREKLRERRCHGVTPTFKLRALRWLNSKSFFSKHGRSSRDRNSLDGTISLI